MTILLNESIQAIGYMVGRMQDILIGVNGPVDGRYKVTYRFRYYDAPDISDPNAPDTKNWYGGECETLEKAMEVFHEMLDMLEARGYSDDTSQNYRIVRGGHTAMWVLEQLRSQPAVHITEERPK